MRTQGEKPGDPTVSREGILKKGILKKLNILKKRDPANWENISSTFKMLRWTLVTVLFSLHLLPYVKPALEYSSPEKFKDALIVTVYKRMVGKCTPEKDSRIMKILVARSRMECTRACSMRTLCGAANYNSASGECVLLITRRKY